MQNLKIRPPAVAGQFYQASGDKLKKQIEGLVSKKNERMDAIACLLPHAGYMYSGYVAGETLSRINIKEKIILLGPNHTGYGAAFSIMTEGTWQTPLGNLKIDSALANDILGRCEYLKNDPLAHLYEHSLEVELPILQYFGSDFEIVPITMLSDNAAILKEIGKAIAWSIRELRIKESTLIIASSDMTHYEPEIQAKKKDGKAIEAILNLDEDSLQAAVRDWDISMCGYAPVATMLSCVKLLGAKDAKLIKYQTSGDITGDKESVVGYAGIVIY